MEWKLYRIPILVQWMADGTFFDTQRKYPKISIPAVTFFDAKESNQRQNCAAVLDSFSWPRRGKTAGFTNAPRIARSPAEKSSAEAKTELACC